MLKVLSTFEATAIVPADANGPYVVNAGAPVLLVPGITHPDATYHWDLGDGAQANTETVQHVYADDGLIIAKLTVKVNQPGGATSRHFAIIRVRNVPPVVQAGADRTVDEGEVVPFTGAFTDVEYGDTHEATWDWGDEQAPTLGVVSEDHASPQSHGVVAGSHAWGDSGTYTVTLTVRDEDGGVGRDTLVVNVRNVPPSVDVGPDLYAYPCTAITLFGKFTDPGWLDTHTSQWSFGDATPPTTAVVRERNAPPAGTGVAIATHVYHRCGDYTAVCTVTDDDGASGQDELTVHVVDLVNGGFERGFRERICGMVANGWEPYASGVAVFGKPPPRELDLAGLFKAFSGQEIPVHGGRRVQRITFPGVYRFGLRQRVGANAGWDYQITAWASIAEESVGTARLGIDPTGGTDPNGASVVWSEGLERGEWRQLAVRAIAQHGFMTVFLEAQGGRRTDLPEGEGLQAPAVEGHEPTCDLWFDDVALLAVQPFCSEEAPSPGLTQVCVAFRDLKPETPLPAVYTRDGFAFESIDGEPQRIVPWGSPPGQGKLFVHAGIVIHPPFPASWVQLTVQTPPGNPLTAVAQDGDGREVAHATTQPGATVQTLVLERPDIVAVRLSGGYGESVLIEVCIRRDPTESQRSRHGGGR